MRDAESGGVEEVIGGSGGAGAGEAGIVKNARGGNRRRGRVCLLELGAEFENELPLVEQELLGVELGRSVLVCLMYVVVDVVAGSELGRGEVRACLVGVGASGEIGRSKVRACLVECASSVVALAARFEQSGVRGGSVVSLGALSVAITVTVASFIVDSIGSALQALDVGFEPGALGLALGSLGGGGVNESLVRFRPFVDEGVPLEQLGGEDVGRKVGRDGGGFAGFACEELLDEVFAASEADTRGVKLLSVRGGELLSALNGLAGEGAALEDGGVMPAPSAVAIFAAAGLDDRYGGS